MPRAKAQRPSVCGGWARKCGAGPVLPLRELTASGAAPVGRFSAGPGCCDTAVEGPVAAATVQSLESRVADESWAYPEEMSVGMTAEPVV